MPYGVLDSGALCVCGLLFASCQGSETSSSPVGRPLLADYDVEPVTNPQMAPNLCGSPYRFYCRDVIRYAGWNATKFGQQEECAIFGKFAAILFK